MPPPGWLLLQASRTNRNKRLALAGPHWGDANHRMLVCAGNRKGGGWTGSEVIWHTSHPSQHSCPRVPSWTALFQPFNGQGSLSLLRPPTHAELVSRTKAPACAHEAETHLSFDSATWSKVCWSLTDTTHTDTLTPRHTHTQMHADEHYKQVHAHTPPPPPPSLPSGDQRAIVLSLTLPV